MFWDHYALSPIVFWGLFHGNRLACGAACLFWALGSVIVLQLREETAALPSPSRSIILCRHCVVSENNRFKMEDRHVR